MKNLKLKLGMGLMIGLVLSMGGFATTYAYSFGVSLNETSWDVDGTTVGYGNSIEKTSYFSATNNGTSLEGLKISATDDKGWTIGDTAAADVFILEHKPTSGGSYAKISSDGNTYLKEELAPSTDHVFDLQLTLPTESTDKTNHTITTTVTTTGPSDYTYNASGDIYYKCLGFGGYPTSWGSTYDHEIAYNETNYSTVQVNILTHTLLSSSTTYATGAGLVASHYSLTSAVWLYPYSISSFQSALPYESGYTSCRGANTTGYFSETVWLLSQRITHPSNWEITYVAAYPQFIILD